MKEIVCPKCGKVLEAGVATCPNCGCPIENLDFNESKSQSTISSDSDSWILKTPYPLSKYPNKGDFAKAHPLLELLLVFPFSLHIVNQSSEDKEYTNSANNILCLFALFAKLGVYGSCWILCKFWWLILLLIVSIIGLSISVYDSDDTAVTVFYILWVVAVLLLVLAGFFGWIAAQSRYLPRIIKTYRRIRKRHWMSIHKAIQNNDIDID